MWEKNGIWPIGGLREIGYKNGSDLLMVLSNDRGIFDCLTNKIIARDYYEYYNLKWDHKTGIVKGFDILEGEDIICGGFEHKDVLNKKTSDNWEIVVKKEKRVNYLNRKVDAEVMYLANKKVNIYIELETFYYGICRAYGFSDTGKTFVIATSGDLIIWKREI